MLPDRSDKKLKFNIISSGVYQVLVMIVPILTTPYVTRIFNVSQMGEFNLSLTIASLFVVLSQFSIETYGSREIAREQIDDKRDSKFFKLLSIQLVTSTMMFLLYNLIFIYILGLENKQLYFIQSLLILINILDISWFFIGIEEIRTIVMKNSITKMLTTLLIFLFIKDSNDLSLYALINVLGTLVGSLIIFISSRKYINFKKKMFNIDNKDVKGSFKLLVPRLLNSSYGSVEKSILQISTTSGNVGIYSEGQKVIKLAFSVINSAFNALMPRMSYHMAKKEYNKVNGYLERGLRYSSFFSIIMVSGIFAVATDFVDFFYGEGYEVVSIILRIGGLTLLFLPITVLLSQGLLVPSGKDKEYSVSYGIILISGIVLNLIMSPQLGSVGAILSYFGAHLLSLIFVVFVTRKYIKPFKIVKSLIFSFAAVLFNILIINNISQIITVNNPIISFLIFGTISVVISGLIIIIISLLGSNRFSIKKLLNDKL